MAILDTTSSTQARAGRPPTAVGTPPPPRRWRLRRQPITTRLTIPCAGNRLVYRGAPLVMGILNVTPDSFSDGGAWTDPDQAVARGVQMAAEGAELLDVGGESTRPGAKGVPVDEELRRVVPVIRRLAKSVRIPISIDTSKAEVAALAIKAGASLVNDVTALQGDAKMAGVIVRAQAAVILMHMQGSPQTMQKRPRYDNILGDIAAALVNAAERARQAGIARSRVLIDPGLGFGKTVAQNLELLKELRHFVSLGFPVVVGPSRKSFIGAALDLQVEERLAGSLACVAYAQRCGVVMVRVHDVRSTVQLIRMLGAIES